MKKYSNILIMACIIGSIWIMGCSEDPDPTNPNPQPDSIIPELTINAASAIETDAGGNMNFEVKTNRSDFSKEITFQYATRGLTAEPNKDFSSTSGQGTIAVGSNSFTISVEILNDDERELDELIEVTISDAKDATIKVATNTGTISDNDMSQLGDEDGYNTPTSYYGYTQIVDLDFDNESVDESVFNFELGDGCDVNLCGWGNSELQKYTNESQNVKLENGKLVITAREDNANAYSSARLTTKSKIEFQYGRIDVRAKLPEGQGLWPAIWMLGTNIDDVGWPACGEIDIMEYLGHEVDKVHGTAHWGEQGASSTFSTGTYTVGTDFSEAFHVYTLIWEQGKLVWYVDENEFHTVTTATASNATWRFNNKFFFVFNVAVGGRWPGNPDETTEFPQSMELDYIRVFQPN